MITNNKDVEILAPCGSYEILKAAVHAGADACYVGGDKFGARAYATNFDKESLLSAIDYAHIHGCRLYLTINTLFKEHELNMLDDYIKDLYVAGIDAVIVQDIGIFKHIRSNYPDIHIHCSTQMNITGAYGASLMKELGATRIVTAREMSLDEIKKIKQEVDIEVETFVHGAMCYSYSGQCLLSSYIGGRSGNRGRCAQPCRKCYNGSYLLSMKDMCSLINIPQLYEAGIDSFKIEGRMKNEYYVASAVDAYRTMTDDYINGTFSEEKAKKLMFKLANVYNRGGFTDGFFFKKNSKDMISVTRPNNQGVCIGNVTGTSAGKVKLKLTNELYKQDVLEISLNNGEVIELTSGINGRRDTVVWLNAPKSRLIVTGQEVYRTRCNYILNDIAENIINRERKLPLLGEFKACINEPMSLSLSYKLFGKEYTGTAFSDIVEKSENKRADKAVIEAKLNALGQTDYNFDRLDIICDEDAFVPLGALKKLRREAIKSLEDNIKAGFKRRKPEVSDNNNIVADYISAKDIQHNQVSLPADNKNSDNIKIHVYLETYEQLKAVLKYDYISGIYIPYELLNSLKKDELAFIKKKEISIFLALPEVFRNIDNTVNYLPNEAINGIYIRNIDGLACVSRLSGEVTGNLKMVVASSLYAYNSSARAFINSLLDNVTFAMPEELDTKELSALNSLDASPFELTLYGYNRVMLTASCVTKTCGACHSEGHVSRLRDDMGNVLYVKAYCNDCYNKIYNKVPYCIFDRLDDIKVKADSFRIDFTIESEDEAEHILTLVRDCIIYKKKAKVDFSSNTGHLFRGVE